MALEDHFSPGPGWMEDDTLLGDDWDARVFQTAQVTTPVRLEPLSADGPHVRRLNVKVHDKLIDFAVAFRDDETRDFRIFSSFMAPMWKTVLRLAGIEGDPWDKYKDHVYPVDTVEFRESFERPPQLRDFQADTLLNVLRESKEKRIVRLAMVQFACMRLRSNLKQFRVARRLAISLCCSDALVPNSADWDEDSKDAFAVAGFKMLVRLSLEEPKDWNVYHVTWDADMEYITNTTLSEEIRSIWLLVCAMALRSEEERMDAADIAMTLSQELLRLAKLGLQRFYIQSFNRGQDMETRVNKATSSPLINLFDALRCVVCFTGFNRFNPPVTFHDGLSACRTCVEKRRKQLKEAGALARRDGEDTYIPHVADVFGSALDLTLQRIVDILYGKNSSQTEKRSEASDDNDSMERNYVVLRGAAVVRYSMGDYAFPLKHYTKVILDDPTNATAYSNRAAVLFKQEKVSAAYQDALAAVRHSQARWAKAHYRIFQVFPHRTQTAREKRRLRSLHEEKLPTMDEEEYVRTTLRFQNHKVTEILFSGWLEDPTGSIEALASLCRAAALGEHVDHQYEYSVRSFLLSDCSRFDDLIKSGVSDVEFKNRLEQLRRSSLVLNLCRELLMCTRLTEIVTGHKGTQVQDPYLTALEERIKEDPENQGPIRAMPELSPEDIREALRAAESDFDCTLCYSLMTSPTTLPCGHSFCRACALRAIEHSSHTDEAKCPVCRASFEDFITALHALGPLSDDPPPVVIPLEHTHTNRALDALVRFAFPEESVQRTAQIDAEEAVLPPTLEASLRDANDPNQLGIPMLWIPRPPDPAYVAQSLELNEPAERLMLRRLVAAKMKVGPSNSSPIRCGLYYARNQEQIPQFGVLTEIDEVGQADTSSSMVMFCTGYARFEVLQFEARDGYKVARVRLLESQTADHDFDTTAWKEDMIKKNKVPAREKKQFFENLMTEAKRDLLRSAPIELLQVALQMYWKLVKKNTRYESDVGLDLDKEHTGGLPYYIAYKLRFPPVVLNYLMFSDFTRENFRERMRLVLLLGHPDGDRWQSFRPIDPAIVQSFPGLSAVLLPSS